jgi:hypothetical protein
VSLENALQLGKDGLLVKTLEQQKQAADSERKVRMIQHKKRAASNREVEQLKGWKTESIEIMDVRKRRSALTVPKEYSEPWWATPLIRSNLEPKEKEKKVAQLAKKASLFAQSFRDENSMNVENMNAAKNLG